MTEIRRPPHEELALRWFEVEPMLRRATARTGCYEPIDILRFVLVGNPFWNLWFIGDLLAVAVTHIEQFPRKRVCNVPFIAGRGLRDWHKDLLATLDAFGRANGCACLAGYSRRGWVRFGFEERDAIMVRNL